EHVSEADLRDALPTLTRLGVPLLVHAEDPRIIAECGMRNPEYGTSHAELPSPFRIPHYQEYLAARPPRAGLEAVPLMPRLARESGARVHIAHVACGEAVEAIARAKSEGVRITAETCPHYLTFAAEEIDDGATEFKCAPPIREARHRD